MRVHSGDEHPEDGASSQVREAAVAPYGSTQTRGGLRLIFRAEGTTPMRMEA